MGNKLRKVFNKNDSIIRGKIVFQDEKASDDFSKALETVYKEGKIVQISGIDHISTQINSGTGSFPLTEDRLNEIVVGPIPDEVILELEVNGRKIEFPFLRYKYNNGTRIETKESFPFGTTVVFDEATVTATVNIKSNFDKALDVNALLDGIETEIVLLEKLFSIDLGKGTDVDNALNHFKALENMIKKLKFVEESFNRKFVPRSIDLDDYESVKDLTELCLLIRDQKAVRSNLKMNQTTGNGLRLASKEAVIGQELLMSFVWVLEYSLWGEKIELHCANLLFNAIVKEIENLDDGQVRVIYGDTEEKPMYITYRGFITEDEAKNECEHIMEHKEEYKVSKTVIQYIEEGY